MLKPHEVAWFIDILLHVVYNVVVKDENNIEQGAMMVLDVNQLLVEAVKETANLNTGEVFLVRELFKGYEWNRIPHRDRLLLGILFLNHVNSAKGDLQAIEKTSSNQQRYRRVPH